MSKAEKIVRLLETKGTRRVFELAEGSVETRDGGSVSWRNNNPGNLKLEYAGSADKTVTTPRSHDAALKSARDRFYGVVALDQWGNAVFESPEAGRAVHATLLSGRHGDRTIPEMLGRYARDDYCRSQDASMVQQNSTHEAIRSGNTQPQALQMAALSR